MLALVLTHLLLAGLEVVPLLLHAVPALLAGPPVVASSSGGGGSGELALLLAGPVSGVALYVAVYRYYRNADKTHRFETETLIALKTDIAGSESKVDQVRGTRRRRIEGDNARDFRRRVERLP